MHKYISLLLLFLLWLPTLLSAQNNEKILVAAYEVEIRKAADGKMSLYNEITKKVIIHAKDKIVVCKNGKYGIINLKNKLLYGMTPHHILTYSNYFEIYDTDKGNIRLDDDLNPLE